MWDLKAGKGSEYAITSKLKGLLKSRLHPLYTAFSLNIKHF